MQNKGKIVAVVIVAAIVVFAVVFSLTYHKNGSSPPSNLAETGSETPSGPLPPTKAPVPANVTVPDAGDAAVSSGIAVPEVQAAAHPSGGDGSYRQFAISADGNAFAPSTTIVRKGDIVDFEMTAVDRDYDFTQPDYGFLEIPLLRGKTQKIQFQALAVGQFTFYCMSCGGPANGPMGHIIVTDVGSQND